MKTSLPSLVAGFALIAVCSATTHASTTIVDFTVNTSIPDDSPTGVTDTQSIAGSTIVGIQSLEVRLKLSGGWNGDIFAYLSHDSGFSVLLNRPGKTSSDTIGSGSSGMDVTFSDFAIVDIHTGISNSGFISGLYQPDARTTDPDLVLDTSTRSAFLSSFNGLNANGSWTLFVSDNSPADESTLLGWGLTITGTPEPSRALLVMFGLGGIVLRRRRVRAV